MPSSSHVTCKHDVQQTSHRILLLFLRSAKVAVTVIRRDGNVVEGNVELLGDVLSWLEDILDFLVLVNVTKELRPYSIS